MTISRERVRNLEALIQGGRLRPPDVEQLVITGLPGEAGGGSPQGSLVIHGGTPTARPHTLTIDLSPTAAAFVATMATGQASEGILFGPRGERKTGGAHTCMLVHADLHRQAGFPLPVKWVGVTDTFQSHRIKTVRSLEDPRWRGIWTLHADDHLAIATIGGTELVHLDLFGIEDVGAMDRLRMEMHGLWIEEPAPSTVLVQSSGVSEDAMMLGMTSLRLPSHCHPTILTSNYPDEDHWTWQRYLVRRHPGTRAFRIPPGECASPAQRAEWARALEGRPDLVKRLLSGEPGAVALGPEVAVGYSADFHVAKMALDVIPSEPLWMAHDAGHWPTTVIGQRIRDTVRIYAGLVTEKAGTRQHLDDTILPWLAMHAPWLLHRRGHIYHVYDPSMDTGDQADTEQSPMKRIRETLGGSVQPGAVTWPARRDPMLAVFNMAHAGRAVLQIDPGPATELLRKALGGRWYYKKTAQGEIVKDLPHKPNHPWEDLGDAFCYLIGGIAPSRVPVDLSKIETQAEIRFDLFHRDLPSRRDEAETRFDLFHWR